MKDIKCVCTAKALMTGSPSALQVASYFDAKGVLEKVQELEFQEAIAPKIQGARRGKPQKSDKSVNPQVNDILAAASCNISDNVQWLKVLLGKFDQCEINYEYLQTAAFVAKNKKIFAFLSQKQKG